MTRTLPVIDRSCGPCTLCCSTHGVDDFENDSAYPDGVKQRHERCVHLKNQRCGIYAERPTSCREFRCLWLQGLLPAHLRPDKVRAVADVNGPGGDMIVLHIQPSDRGAHRKGALGEWVARKAAAGISFYIVCGDERHAMGPVAAQIKSGDLRCVEQGAGLALFHDALSRLTPKIEP